MRAGVAGTLEATEPRATRYRGLLALTLTLITIGCIAGIAVPAGLGWDFANFYDAGHRVVAGQSADLYHQERLVEGRPTQGRMRFWSAPLAAAAFAPLAFLPPSLALVTFKLQNVFVLGIALLLLYRLSRRYIADDFDHGAAFPVVFASMCLIYQPFWTVFRVGGQSTPTVFLLVVCGLLSFMSSRLLLAALLVVAAVMIKPTLVLFAGFLACIAGGRFLAALLAAGGVLGAISLVAFGWPLHLEFLHVAIEGSRLARGWQFNSSLYSPLESLRLFGVSSPGAAAVLITSEWILRAAIIVLFVYITRSSRRTEWPIPAKRHFEFAMALLFWLMVSQTLWEHYLGLLFVPVVYLVAMRRSFPHTVQYALAGILLLSLAQNLILMEWLWTRVELTSAPALLLLGLVKAGPLLLMLMILASQRTALFATYRAPEWR